MFNYSLNSKKFLNLEEVQQTMVESVITLKWIYQLQGFK